MKTVKLRNGSEEVVGMVPAVTMHLRRLPPEHLTELAIWAGWPDYNLPEDTKVALKACSLMQPDGRFHTSIKNVIQSALVIDHGFGGSTVKIVSPIQEEPNA